MKKSYKILCTFIFLLLLLALSKGVKANSISKISMDIAVDNNGTATVTEIWNCNVSGGTEVYHPYYNLGNSKISNLEVSEGSKSYTSMSSWNTSGSLSSKAYKCGINTISNGVELCWGISKYGSHTYTIKYTITNFVSDLTDSQMIYWNLIPYDFSSTIGSAYIKIHTNFDIANSVGVWGYGDYGGTAYVYDGYIEMQSNGSLTSGEYMTILVQFPSGTFNASNKINQPFSYYQNMADEGSTKYTKPTSNSSSSVGSKIFGGIIKALYNFIPWMIMFFVFGLVGRKSQNRTINFGIGGKKISNDIPYYRDIPCNSDLFRAYYIGYNYGLLKSKTDILGAIILKWLKDDIVKIDKKECGMIFKKEDSVIVLTNCNINSITNSKERDLFRMLYDASKDGILENKEFEKWCSTSYEKILNWFNDIIKEEKENLVKDGLIIEENKKYFKIFSYTEYTATPQLKQEAINLAGLKRYLKDYTLINERTPIEVKLFEEYLIYAQMMGIAKEVAKEFKDLYPDIIEQSHYSSFDNIVFINMCTSHGVSNAYSAKSRAESYSSGGGGFSSGGGGGGSFGGGSGGGGFR